MAAATYNYVAGGWRESTTGDTFEVRTPADTEDIEIGAGLDDRHLGPPGRRDRQGPVRPGGQPALGIQPRP